MVLPATTAHNHGIFGTMTSKTLTIDVVVFTLLATDWHIQGHALHPYIMVDASVPWFDPNISIGREATVTAAAATSVAMTTVTAVAVVAAALARRHDATINQR